MSDPQTKTPQATDDRGPAAEKVEIEKRLDRNAELEEQGKKADGKTSQPKRAGR